MLALVVLPFGAASPKNAAWPQKGLIYVGNATQITASVNTDRVRDVTNEAQLVEEALDLATHSGDEKSPVQTRVGVSLCVLRLDRGDLSAVEELLDVMPRDRTRKERRSGSGG